MNLKIHTEFSLLEGVGKIDEYIEKAKKLEQKVLGITDNSMFGVIEFYDKCKKNGIKPLIGLEIFLNGLFVEGEYCLTLFAKNENGYKNLLKLSSLSYSRFNKKRNKIEYSELKEYSEDLYIFSGGVNSEIVKGFERLSYFEAKKCVEKLAKDFGENFFVEIPVAKNLEKVRQNLIEVIRKMELNYVISNDVFYVNNGDAILQKIVNCIKEGSKISFEEDENIYEDLYMKSTVEMQESFKNLEDIFEKGIKNLEKIVENCNVEIEFGNFKFPKYELPEGMSEKEFIRKLVFEGLSKKFLKRNIVIEYESDEILIEEELVSLGLENILERVEYELKTIDKMGYNGYFIIVWDFIRFSKENGIYVGPGRGSAAGSLVAYALNITEIDPLKYNLIFERFLNPERISMPDIDIDFDQEQREQVIEYVFEKYGSENVAHIITFGTLKARAAIRDVARVLGVPLIKIDNVTKMIPSNMGLLEALKNIWEIRKLYNEDKEIKRVIDFSIRIEGNVRHTSVHAAGIVISKNKLVEEVPTYSDGREKILTTQYQMKELEQLGILKIDFLGLKNLTILRKCVENIEKSLKNDESIISDSDKNIEIFAKNGKIDLNEIPLNDKKAFELMTKGDTLGIFQCESLGIRKLMQKMKIDKFEDIVALLALYRPGPLRSGMVDDFINAKNNKVEIKYIHNSLENTLKETYGVILYQEQVMKIVSEIADYSLAEADELRRAIGKKIPKIIEENREKFVKNALDKGIDKIKANEIYSLIEKFGGYGFNKSHSAAYAMIVYWTAYFKANYPVQFFSAIMSTEMYSIERISLFVNEARNKDVKILLPDVNYSDYEFQVEDGIRFGIMAVKGIGLNTAKDIIEERKKGKFISYFDFIYRMRKRGINKKNVEALILSGSLDSLDGNKKEKFLSINEVFKLSEKKYEAEEDQKSIFKNKSFNGNFEMEKSNEYSKEDLMKYEKEYLGVYILNNPLEKKRKLIDLFYYTKILELEKVEENKKVRLIGIVKKINKIVTKKSQKTILKFILEDFSGEIEIICFSKKIIEINEKIWENKIVIAEGKIKNEENGKKIFVLDDIWNIEKIQENKNLKLYILIDDENNEKMKDIRNFILENHGENRVILALDKNGKKEIVKLKNKYNVNLTIDFLRKLTKLVNLEKIKLR